VRSACSATVLQQYFDIKSSFVAMTTTSCSLPPVVFIHGWKASVLADKKAGHAEFDYTVGVLSGLAKDPSLELPLEWDVHGNQVKDNLVATEPCHSITCLCGMVKLQELYGPVLDHLERTRDLHVFAYDWRLCLNETATDFEKFLVDVRESTGRTPQVVAHSMGCLITLSVLNRCPKIFHSILFGAGAMGPAAAPIKDFSLLGENNTNLRNTTMLTPKVHLSNPSAFHMLSGYPGERELFGRAHPILFKDEDDEPLELDMCNVKTWKKYRVGVYHPDSGIDAVDGKTEAWFQSVLDKVRVFRQGLLPKNSGLKASDCPPISVLRGDHTDTEFCYSVRHAGLDLKEGIGYLRGDNRVTLEDTLPPKDIPVCKIVTNDRAHVDVLNDIENVDMLLKLLISKSK